MKKLIPVIILAWIAYIVFTTSCANPGIPTGGDKDTIPPVIVETKPEFNARSFDGNEIMLTFDEFIMPEGLSEVLLVSPPLKKRPLIKTKSKTLIIDLGENLRENTTYSLNFKDAIVDNNEKNPLEDFRFSFSTGENFDSLMIGGYVKQAYDLEPIEGAMVLLHKITELSAFTDSLPDYIARTDKEGFFIISNVAEGNYRLYAIQDADNSLTFNQPTEQIAFYDTLVVPHDWNVVDILPDTLGIIEEKKQELPTPYFLMMYEEDYYDQYLDSYKRVKADLCTFYFSESLTDSFKLELIHPKVEHDWSFLHYNPSRDSLSLWITDTLLSNTDTLNLRLDYIVKDTLEQFVYRTDTLEMYFKKKETKGKKKKKDIKKVKTRFINLSTNLRNTGFDVHRPLQLNIPEPLEQFDRSGLHLYELVDSLEEELDFEILQDTVSMLNYYLEYPWEYEKEYRFVIDSASLKNYFGDPNNTLDRKFQIQKEGYYAKIILSLSNVRGHSIVQLLKNNKEENVLQEIMIDEDGQIEFPLLKPEKYKIKLIVDDNNNGKWDIGDVKNDIQPEKVIYFQKILKLRSNFEVRESWNLPQNLQFKKDLVDEDKEKNDSRRSSKSRAGSRSRPRGGRGL